MTLIQELHQHVTNDNVYYIEELCDIFIEENIKTVEELEAHEKQYNKVNDEYVSIEEAIKNCIHDIDTYPYEYDGLLFNEIQTLKEERKLMNDESIDNQILHLIKYYYLTNRDNPFPYHTYKFIMEDKL